MILKNIILILPFLAAFIFALTLSAGDSYSLPYFLFGLFFKLNSFTHTFLLFSAFIWLVAAIASVLTIKSDKKLYWILFYLTYLGNFALVAAADVITFYIFFSLMSFSAFGLILHSQSKASYEAAFSYIKFAVFGEILLFLGVVYLVYLNQSPFFSELTHKVPPLLLLLILSGFGVKAGLFLLHPWLPKAHAQAPAPISALLSGVMLKTGVLGWIQFISLGSYSYPFFGKLLVVLGFLGVFGGIYGVFQKQLKQVLAYSSISQMGYLSIVVGMVLIQKELFIAAKSAILLFILHHGFVKAALFLVAGQMQKNGADRFSLLLAFLGALLLIGVPFSSGAIAKLALKEYLLFGILLFSISSFVTAFLMVRFLFLANRLPKKQTQNLSFLVIVLLLPPLFMSYFYAPRYSFEPMQLIPLFVAACSFYYLQKKRKTIPLFPQGDIAAFVTIPSFKLLKKPIHEKKIDLEGLQKRFAKLEKLLQTQRYSLTLLLFFVLLFYLFSSL